MPTSAAPRRARCRRSRAHRGRGRADRQLQAGRRRPLREAETRRCWRARSTRRATRQNLADLRAQIAANEKGVEELRKMVAVRPDVVQAYMGHVQDNAEEAVRRVITR
jgi:5-oxoprolinase (ATP-hydrolysing)